MGGLKMPALNRQVEMKMKDVIGQNLSLRKSADFLFDELELYTECEFILDFKGINSMSRSFAQQFINRLNQSSKKIVCTNESFAVTEMFRNVRTPKEKTKLVELKPSKIMPFSC